MSDKNNPMISVLTSCYNSESYMQRYIDTILYQTYDNIELILINNGSTDKTEDIILSNREALEKKCKKFIYIRHENVLQIGASINDGLKHVTGTYLTWPDSDDIMYPNYLATKVSFLEDNPQYDFCFNATDVVNENDLNLIIRQNKRVIKDDDDKNLFEDLIFSRNVFFEPIASCIRTESFWKVVPEHQIYPGILGQNWQFLLPMAYHYKCGYIQESLAKYVLRPTSESNKPMRFLQKNKYYYDILINTVKSIDMSIIEKIKYLFLVKEMLFIKFAREFFIRCFFIRQIKKYFKSKEGN